VLLFLLVVLICFAFWLTIIQYGAFCECQYAIGTTPDYINYPGLFPFITAFCFALVLEVILWIAIYYFSGFSAPQMNHLALDDPMKLEP